MLAFGAPSLGGAGVVLLAQIRYDDWRLAPAIMIVALAIGMNGAVGRFRDLKHQRRRRDDHAS
jgi:hypothetical protein